MGSCIGTSPGGDRAVPMSVTMYRDGRSTNFRPDAQQSEEIHSCLVTLLDGADEVMRVYVGDDRIANLRVHERCVEIQYDSSMLFTKGKFAPMRLTRIFLPLSGDLAGTDTSPVATMIVGDPEYQSGPLRNPTGWPVALELDSLVERSAKPK